MMQRIKKPFTLPMMLTHVMVHDAGKCVAHSLDFDIVCVAAEEQVAWEKLRLAIKTYVEFGISNGWQDSIVFPAPQEFWDKLTPETPLQLGPPITIAGMERKVVEAEVCDDRVAA
jgi:hypothetical protein